MSPIAIDLQKHKWNTLLRSACAMICSIQMQIASLVGHFYELYTGGGRLNRREKNKLSLSFSFINQLRLLPLIRCGRLLRGEKVEWDQFLDACWFFISVSHPHALLQVQKINNREIQLHEAASIFFAKHKKNNISGCKRVTKAAHLRAINKTFFSTLHWSHVMVCRFSSRHLKSWVKRGVFTF